MNTNTAAVLNAVGIVLKRRLGELKQPARSYPIPTPTLEIPAPVVENHVPVPRVENIVPVPEVVVNCDMTPIADAIRESTQQMAENYARLAEQLGETVEMLRQAVVMLADAKPPVVKVVNQVPD